MPAHHPLDRRRSRPRHRARDGGQALPLVVVAVAVSAAVVLALVRQGSSALDAARARTAADAAALAGAAEGPAAARRLAAANGATIAAISSEGGDVVVTVRVGRSSATARARWEGTWCRAEPSGVPSIPYTSLSCPSSQGSEPPSTGRPPPPPPPQFPASGSGRARSRRVEPPAGSMPWPTRSARRSPVPADDPALRPAGSAVWCGGSSCGRS